MKAVVMDAVLNGFRSRKDKSVGFTVSSPELTTVEKVALMDLEGINVRLLIEPIDYEAESKVTVKSDLNEKSPSERQRACLFVLFKHEQATGSVGKDKMFPVYYAEKMETIINTIKAKLPATDNPY